MTLESVDFPSNTGTQPKRGPGRPLGSKNSNFDGISGPAYSTAGAALRLGVSVATLKRWRRTGEGPSYIRHSPRKFTYHETDCAAYEEAVRIRPASNRGEGGGDAA